MTLRRPTHPDLVDTSVPWCLTDEHKAWRKSLRDFVETEVRPGALERSRAGVYDEKLASRMGETGLLGILIPEEYGGMGGDMVSACLAVEELARVDCSIAVTMHVQTINSALLNQIASREQKELLLPSMASGELFVAVGVAEPSGASDTRNIMTKAVQDGSDWVINGAKQFITNSGTSQTGYIMIVANTGVVDGTPETSVFLVPTETPGLQVAPSYQKIGWLASDTHPLFLDNVRVPESAIVGGRGTGFVGLMRFLLWTRILIAAMSTGLAQGCLEETYQFVSGRESFGKPLTDFQTVGFTLADLATMTHTARTLTYDAAWKYDRGMEFNQEAAMCKLVASELANKVAYKATQMHGGYGFIDESAVARHYRDARVLTIGEGTSELQHLAIARTLGFPNP